MTYSNTFSEYQPTTGEQQPFSVLEAFASLLGYQDTKEADIDKWRKASELVFYTLITSDNQMVGLYDTLDRAERGKTMREQFEQIQVVAILPIQLKRRAFFELVKKLEQT